MFFPTSSNLDGALSTTCLATLCSSFRSVAKADVIGICESTFNNKYHTLRHRSIASMIL